MKYQVKTGDALIAHLRNGQNFTGSDLAYFPHQFVKTEVAGSEPSTPYVGRMGDIPAFDITPSGPGLTIFAGSTTPAEVKYKTWAEFDAFLQAKGLNRTDIRINHAARQLPETDFWERYTRHVKTLVAVDHGAGQDRRFGLTLEFVALQNPYTQPGLQNLPVQLWQGDRRLGHQQITVFAQAPSRPGDTVTKTLLTTDADGTALVPVQAGYSYLLDAVTIAPAIETGRAVWATQWSALTFAIPAD